MLWLSEVLLQNPEFESFEDLKDEIAQRAAAGERFFRMDIKPPFADTPTSRWPSAKAVVLWVS